MSKSAAELRLVQAGAFFLAGSGFLALDSALGGVTPPPGRRFGRVQFFEAMPFLNGNEHDRLAAWA